MSKPKKYSYVNDKCNPPGVNMGKAFVFADAIPGMNDNIVKPFGWTEYESAYRPLYIPDPCGKKRPCRDPCKPRIVEKPAPRQFHDPCCKVDRLGICNICKLAKCCCSIPPPWEECREKVVLYGADNVRNLFVHNEVKTEHPIVLSTDQYCRIFNTSKGENKEDKIAECKKLEAEKKAKIEDCRELAEEMRLIDQCRIRDSLSPEAREDMDEILCRADTIIKNDTPEVRSINQVILAAKVQAIREAQLTEKLLIRCEQDEEDRRIDEMMKQDIAHALIKNDDQELDRIEAKKQALRAALKLQRDEKEAYSYLEKQLKEQEREQLKKLWEQQELEDLAKRKLEIEKKQSIGRVLMQNTLESIEHKRKAKEFDKAEDLRLIEWQNQRKAEEEKAENLKNEEKKAKALAIREAGEAQKRQLDSKALRDELRAKRHQEEQEREWRRRERENIRKKQDDAEELRRTILQQIRDKQDYFCEQAAYEKAAYDRLYKIQLQQIQDDSKTIEAKKIENAKYKFDLREQIHDYQLRRIQERKQHFIEGIQMRRELAQRDRELKCTMEQKMEELRDSCLPEKYLNYIRKAVEQELKPEWQKPIAGGKH